MAIGPGKYDDICTVIREMTGASCAMIVIIDGTKGSGFSIQSHSTILNSDNIATLLENIANQIREEST